MLTDIFHPLQSGNRVRERGGEKVWEEVWELWEFWDQRIKGGVHITQDNYIRCHTNASKNASYRIAFSGGRLPWPENEKEYPGGFESVYSHKQILWSTEFESSASVPA